jgi:hypothetical protein
LVFHKLHLGERLDYFGAETPRNLAEARDRVYKLNHLLHVSLIYFLEAKVVIFLAKDDKLSKFLSDNGGIPQAFLTHEGKLAKGVASLQHTHLSDGLLVV